MKKLTTLLFLAMTASQLGATDCGNVLRDPGFDLWCGDELCAWKVERGDIKRIPTWNGGDPGVELVGTDVALEQLSPVDSGDGYCEDQPGGGSKCTYPADVCIEFSLLANIDEATAVDLNVDVFGDGVIDTTQRLPIGHWQPLAYKIVIKRPFAGIRFEIAKAGTGTAQLANIGARVASNCAGLPVITPHPAPLGSPCLDDAGCASGICELASPPVPFPGVTGFLQPDKVCVGCDATDHACAVGEACGLTAPVSPVRAASIVCVAEASKQLGEQCNGDVYDPRQARLVSECASGHCSNNVCSTCDFYHPNASGCANGETCEAAWQTGTGYGEIFECNPHASLRASGEACANNDDCASGTCNGTERKQCSDGRACIDASQCPFDNSLKNGACTTVGIQGGSCQ